MKAGNRAFFGALIVVLMGLGACSTQGPFEEKDRGPDRPVDTSHVPHEVRTAAGNKNPYTVLGQTYHLMDDETGYREQGIASWYGKKFHGRRTSNGEVYDMYAMTAAHKTLPIPSYVRVTNLDNRRQVVVRVNDRGPFHGGRIIDLSYAAAQRLGFANHGTARVEVEIIVPGDQPPAPLRAEEASDAVAIPSGEQTYLQVGAFSTLGAAEQQRERVSGMVGYPVVIHSPEELPELHRVRIGPLTNTTEVAEVREQLRRNAIEQTHIVKE